MNCGAKNAADLRRCRLCTAVINPDIPEAAEAPEAPAPAGTDVLADHFDAGQLDRQIQPAKSRFSGGSGLGARIAAANGGQIPPTPTFADQASADPGLADRPATPEPTAAPVEHEEEPFDPDALFRDMG